MTQVYGLCGIGWKFEVTKQREYTCPDGQIMLLMEVALYIKDGDTWSQPVYGRGGDYIIKANKGQYVANDDVEKACLTDALGNAMKFIGVASDVYKGLYNDSKYSRGYGNGYANPAPAPAVQAPPRPAAAQASPTPAAGTYAGGKLRKAADGSTEVQSLTGSWFSLDRANPSMLTAFLEKPEYAEAKSVIEAALATRR